MPLLSAGIAHEQCPRGIFLIMLRGHHNGLCNSLYFVDSATSGSVLFVFVALHVCMYVLFFNGLLQLLLQPI